MDRKTEIANALGVMELMEEKNYFMIDAVVEQYNVSREDAKGMIALHNHSIQKIRGY